MGLPTVRPTVDRDNRPAVPVRLEVREDLRERLRHRDEVGRPLPLGVELIVGGVVAEEASGDDEVVGAPDPEDREQEDENDGNECRRERSNPTEESRERSAVGSGGSGEHTCYIGSVDPCAKCRVPNSARGREYPVGGPAGLEARSSSVVRRRQKPGGPNTGRAVARASSDGASLSTRYPAGTQTPGRGPLSLGRLPPFSPLYLLARQLVSK